MTLRSYSAPASGVLSCHSGPSPHAALITPADRLGTVSVLVRVSPRREFPSRAGLPGTKDRSAPADLLFEACSSFTRVAACGFAHPPFTCGLGRKASTSPVPRRRRFSAIQAYRKLLERDLHPLGHCAMRAHVESRNGAGARRSRFHSPLIEPDRPISGIRLSDRLHGKAHAGSPDRAQRWTPRTPKMVSVENRRVPRTPLDKWRRRRKDRTRCST